MINKLLYFGLTGIILFCSSCKNDEGKEIEVQNIEFRDDADLYLINKEDDTIKTLDIEIADDDYSKATGLMYRESMEETQGMLFVYKRESIHNFYMKNTYIPLDLIFFDSDSTIVSFQKDAKPLDESLLPSQVPDQFILEINGGLSERWGLKTGDRFSVQQ